MLQPCLAVIWNYAGIRSILLSMFFVVTIEYSLGQMPRRYAQTDLSVTFSQHASVNQLIKREKEAKKKPSLNDTALLTLLSRVFFVWHVCCDTHVKFCELPWCPLKILKIAILPSSFLRNSKATSPCPYTALLLPTLRARPTRDSYWMKAQTLEASCDAFSSGNLSFKPRHLTRSTSNRTNLQYIYFI